MALSRLFSISNNSYFGLGLAQSKRSSWGFIFFHSLKALPLHGMAMLALFLLREQRSLGIQSIMLIGRYKLIS